MFDYFKLFDLLVLTCDIMVVRLLFLDFVQKLPIVLPSWRLIPHLKTVSYNNQWLKLIWMKLNNYMTLNDTEINSLHKNNNWLTHLSLKYNWLNILFLLLQIHYSGNPTTNIDLKTRTNLSIKYCLVINQRKQQ